MVTLKSPRMEISAKTVVCSTLDVKCQRS
ncbi:hypothetical protein E2C01_056709 [Portunus trituberculatus]|uniref:Uncharacterized protein n=1 Tax=Portunus trituberculatus TaxID=210409 RepID=A0A5B7GRJ9_PORTR|nr:hypothetical protein [Portunus trituberculatus]